MKLLSKLLSWLNCKLNIVATGAENDYYAWADERLDQIANGPSS